LASAAGASQNRGCLQVAKLKLFHQVGVRLGHVFGCADGLDDLVDMVERLFEAEQNVLALLAPW
jgi:hypothetical protein